MYYIKYCINFIFLLLIPVLILSQETGKPFFRNYSPKEYKGHTQNWAIIQDKFGMLYFGNQEGVLEYDGTNWRQIKTTNNSTVRSLDIDSTGNIYVGAVGEFGKLIPDNSGKLTYISFVSLFDSVHQDFADVWNTRITNDGIYFLTDNILFRYNHNNVKTWKKQGNYFYMCKKVYDELYIHEYGIGLKIMKNDSLHLLKNGEKFANLGIHTIVPFKEKSLLIGGRNFGLVEYNLNKEKLIKFSEPVNKFLKENQLYHGVQLTDNKYIIGTVRKGAIVINDRGEFLQYFNQQNSLQNESVYFIHYRTGQNLWFGLDNGISRIEMDSPFRFWDKSTGLKGTIIDIIRNNGQLYVATGLGIYYLDVSDTLKAIDKFKHVEGIAEQSWCFINFDYQYNNNVDNKKSFKENNSILLAGTSMGIYEIKNDKAKIIHRSAEVFSLYQSKKYPKVVFIGYKDGIGKMVWNEHTNKWKIFDKIKGVNYEIRSIADDSNGDLWLGPIYKSVIKISFNENNTDEYYDNNKINKPVFDENVSIQSFDTTNGFPLVKQTQIYNYNNELIFATNKGIYRFDENTSKFFPDNTFGNGYSLKSISKLCIDKNNNVWINGKEVYIFQEDSSYIKLDIPFKRLPETIVESIYAEDNGITWIGSAEGLFRFDINYYKNYNIPFYTLIRKISIGKDSIIFYGSNIKEFNREKYNIDYKNNKIVFEYSSPFFEDENKNKYSYFLKGFDSPDGKWSDWSSETKKEYTNLNEGNYVFYVKAKNIYDIESKPAIFKFIISPPFYRTFLAYFSYLLIVILIIWYIIKLRTKRLLLEKKNLENIIIERTSEITQQKEEIQAQAESLKIANKNIIIKNKELEKQKNEIVKQAEKLIKNNIELEKLSVIARKTDNAVSVYDKTGKLEWFNEGFKRMYGYTFEQFVSERGQYLKVFSRNLHIKEVIKACVEDKKTIIYEFLTLTRSEERIWAQTTMTPIINKDGETTKLIAIDSDITKLKNAEQKILYQKREIEKKSRQLEQTNKELEKLSIVASETDNAIIIMDPKGNVEWINEGFTRIYGYTLEQLINEKDKKLIGASSNLNIKDIINVWYGDKKPIIYESLNKTRAGQDLCTQTTLTPIIDDKGNIKKLIAIDTDITKLKKAETKIEKQRDELQIANATKDKFFSIIAHDLRGPFSNFVSLTKIIVDSFNSIKEITLKDYLKEIQNSAQKTYNLLENLLDWSRSQQGDIKYEPKNVEISLIVNENIELLKNMAEKKNIKIDSYIPDNIFGYIDENMIKTVLRNLISNAIKFSDKKGKIDVSFTTKGKFHEITISDTGIGIKQEDIKKLFRIDVHHTTMGTQKEKGTGLGLILCKEFVEKHGGKITIKSKIGKGSKFIFTIPVNSK
ncbi:MAG: PAS domain-containing protein [Bacteroidales bacterium]|nr:PAS domain-containing protein [Bacteroidales bacterium]